MMAQPVTISFVGTTELKTLLEQWAKQDDRSVSYVMREILTCEAQRRQYTQPKAGQSKSQLKRRPSLTDKP